MFTSLPLATVLRTLGALMLLLACLGLSACPKKTEVITQETNTPAPAGSESPNAEPATADQTAAPAADSASTTTDTSSSDTAADATAGESAESSAADGSASSSSDGNADLRPADKKDEKPKGVWVVVDFMNATFNEDPQARLSKLDFHFGADFGRNDNVEADLEMTDPEKEIFTTLDLRFCKLRIYPYVGNASIAQDKGTLQEYVRDGRYVFMLFDPADKALGVVEMNTDGEFHPAPPTNQPKELTIVPRFNSDHELEGYDIAKVLEKGKPIEVVLQLRVDRGGFTEKRVTDPKGNVFTYRFPNVHLLVAPPEVDVNKPIRPR